MGVLLVSWLSETVVPAVGRALFPDAAAASALSAAVSVLVDERARQNAKMRAQTGLCRMSRL